MGISSIVWDRAHGGNTLSARSYIAATSFFTIGGLVLSAIVGYMTATSGWQPGILEILLVGLGIPIVGMVIAFKSDNWFISAFGLSLVVSGLGAIIGPVVIMYELPVVLKALASTMAVTVAMSIIGIVYPKSLEHWGGYLFGALLALLAVRILQMFGLFGPSSGWYMIIEYLGALLFSLYIIYDWNRAMRLSYNLDNAVDCAVALYLDIANLFLHLLRIYGGSSSSD
jgi:FtsH-binding integral membrane protein